MGLPDWQSYYKASALTWIKDWIELKNIRTLILEGFDLTRGWHAYLWGEKITKQEQFRRHIVRDNLLKIWNEIRKYHYDRIPRWTSIMEAHIYPNTIDTNKLKTYQDILNEEGKLKTREELRMQNVEIEWWSYLQLKSRYKSDMEKTGIQMEPNQLDKILLGPNEKLITKIYNFLMEYKLAEEVVKENMITWATNFGYAIELNK